jgi:hypothetical protein
MYSNVHVSRHSGDLESDSIRRSYFQARRSIVIRNSSSGPQPGNSDKASSSELSSSSPPSSADASLPYSRSVSRACGGPCCPPNASDVSISSTSERPIDATNDSSNSWRRSSARVSGAGSELMEMSLPRKEKEENLRWSGKGEGEKSVWKETWE